MIGPSSDRKDTLVRSLLTGGALAGPLFVGTFLVEGATRADYDPLRHPVSSLALGPGGWVQTANFAVAGVLYVGFGAGLILARSDGLTSRSSLDGEPWVDDETHVDDENWVDDETQVDDARRVSGAADRDEQASSRLGAILLAASGLGLIGSAIFVTDPVSGYPPGTADALEQPTTAGFLHDVSAVPIFLGLPAAQLLYARAFRRAGRRGWPAYSAGTAAAMFTGFALASAGFAQTPAFVRVGGLLQRAAVISALGWETALALQALRRHRNAQAIKGRRG
jgi:hypothetical protein